MNRAFEMIFETYREKRFEEMMDSGAETIESMVDVWNTEDSAVLREIVLRGRLRSDVRARCLRDLDIADVRQVMPKNGPYRSF